LQNIDSFRRVISAFRGRLEVLKDVVGLCRTRVRYAVWGLPQHQTLPAWNNLHAQKNLSLLAREKALLETFDLYLYRTLNTSYLRGQIVFEYGTLLNHLRDWRGLRVLDVGAGRSSLPRWMAMQGASVVAFEYPDQVEKPALGWRGRINKWVQRRAPEPELAYGTMLQMPLPDKSFDLVCSLSVIEHLDTNLPDLRYVPYPEQKRRAVQTLCEMVRVTRPGGLLYLTSECCQYRVATSDTWQNSYYYKQGPDRDLKEPRFSSAWPVDEIPEIFHETLKNLGCELVGTNALDPASLDGNPEYASFRGPHFSAFCLLARRRK
jgi:SAM-dependent methyltransferase